MRLAQIRQGDIVQVRKAGTEFHAFVTDKQPGELKIRPVCHSIGKWRPVTGSMARPREVVGHWRLREGVRARV